MTGKKMVNIISIKAIVCVAELAIHVDAALFIQNAVALFLADRLQSSQSAFPGAAAAEGHRLGIEQANGFFVEQTVQQRFAVETEQLLGLDGACQVINPIPQVIIFFSVSGQSLQQEPGGSVFIGKQEQTGGQLLGTFKVFLQASCQGVRFPGNYTLVPLPLIRGDGNRHPAVAQQLVQGFAADGLLVEAGQSANMAVMAAL